MELELRKLKGSDANRWQVRVTWLWNVGLLVASATESPNSWTASYLLCCFLLLVTLLNLAHHVRNAALAEVLHLGGGSDRTTLSGRVLQGHGFFKLFNGVCALGACSAALVLASQAQHQFDSMAVAVLSTAFATVNWSKTERDQFEAQAWLNSHSEQEERFLPAVKQLNGGTTAFVGLNVISAGFAVTSAYVAIAERAELAVAERLLLALAVVFLIVSSVNASKMIRDAPGRNSCAWQGLTVVSLLLAVTACVAGPLVLDLSARDRLFFETNFLWVLASTLSCAKVLRDRYDALAAQSV